jgi:hypothetical protein
MAGCDSVILPYEFWQKIEALIESIPEDEFECCVDDVESDI